MENAGLVVYVRINSNLSANFFAFIFTMYKIVVDVFCFHVFCRLFQFCGVVF